MQKFFHFWYRAYPLVIGAMLATESVFYLLWMIRKEFTAYYSLLRFFTVTNYIALAFGVCFTLLFLIEIFATPKRTPAQVHRVQILLFSVFLLFSWMVVHGYSYMGFFG